MAAGLVISAPASGVGKTTLTLALARAWRNQRIAGAVLQERPRLYRSRVSCRRDGTRLGQCRQLGDGSRDDLASRQSRHRRRCRAGRGLDGPVRRRRRARRLRHRRDRRHRRDAGLAGAAGDRSLGTGADGGGDRRGPSRLPPRRAPCRRGAQSRCQPAPSKPSCGVRCWTPASPCSARCRAMPRSACRSGISDWCRPRSRRRSAS